MLGRTPISYTSSTPSGARIKGKFIAGHLFYVLRFFSKEVLQPKNNLSILSAWCESFHQQFLAQCSCYFVATPACKWGPDWYKTWAIAATSDKIQTLAGQCTHNNHQDIGGKRLPDGPFSASKLAAAIIDIIRPWVSQSSSFNQDFTQWKSLLAKKPLARGPRITDGAGNNSSANRTIPLSQDIFKEVRKRWITRILNNHLHSTFVQACHTHQSDAFITDNEVLPFIQDLQAFFPFSHMDTTILNFQPFRLKLLHTLLTLAQDPDADIALRTFTGRHRIRSFVPVTTGWPMGTEQSC